MLIANAIECCITTVLFARNSIFETVCYHNNLKFETYGCNKRHCTVEEWKPIARINLLYSFLRIEHPSDIWSYKFEWHNLLFLLAQKFAYLVHLVQKVITN